MTFRPPKNDSERLQNLIEALSEPGDEDDELDEIMHAELTRRGHTLETWAAQWQARAQAVIDQNDRARRARRIRAAKIGVAVTAGVAAAAAGGVLAVEAMRERMDGADLQQTIRALPPLTQPDAGRNAPKGR